MSEPTESNPMPPTFQGVILPFEQPKMPKLNRNDLPCMDGGPTSLSTVLEILNNRTTEMVTAVDALYVLLEETLIKSSETELAVGPYPISSRDGKLITQLLEYVNRLVKAENQIRDIFNRCQV